MGKSVKIPPILRSFVRNAPQYQHMPDHAILGKIWQWLAGFLYFLKQEILYFPKSAKRLRSLRQMRNTKKNKPVLIIGNGPSAITVTKEHIKKLKLRNADVITMNNYDKTAISDEIIPEFHFLLDPEYQREEFDGRKSIVTYLASHPEIQVIQSSLVPAELIGNQKPLFVNGIQAVGLWKSDSPLKANTYPQGVLFSALKFAHFLGYSPIYVTGIDNSFYKNHLHNQIGTIVIDTNGLHAYSDESNGKFAKTIPFLTRNMSDVLFAHAIFLQDLRKFGKGKTIVNVGLSDYTNDAFPFACLLP